MISKDRHNELGLELARIRLRLMEIDSEVAAAYGKTRKPYGGKLAHAVQDLVFARAEMGVKAGDEHDDMDWGVKAYGGRQHDL